MATQPCARMFLFVSAAGTNSLPWPLRTDLSCVLDLPEVPEELRKVVAQPPDNAYSLRLHELRFGESLFDCTLKRTRQGDLMLELHNLEWEQMRQRIQQRELQTGMLELLSRNLGHEVRNPLGGILGAAQMLADELESEELETLAWLIMLHRKSPRKTLAIHDGTFPALLKTLSDPADAVVTRDLTLLSQISKNSDDSYFTSFMVNLLKLFCTDRKLLEIRGNLIIRQLCLNLSAERIYRTLADCLEKDDDVEFASIMVQNLNNNLITAPELADLRKRLRNLENRDGQTFFVTLFRAWCHNAVATFSLCLLAQAYEQAYNLLQIIAELEMTVNMLIQIDKLVQLLESPVFTYLRLQLLEPERFPHLYKCLYGLLMLLPQSSAFAALKNRLNSVSAIGYLHIAPRT